MRWIYGRIVEATGWTYPQIDALRVSEMEELFEHWREEPPAGVVLRAHYPTKRQSGTTSLPAQDRDITPREVTQAEFDALVAESRRGAEKYGSAL